MEKKNIGAVMGSRPVPSNANILMAKIDGLIKELNGAYAIQLMKRFLDDFFIIFLGSSIELHDLFQKINNIHPTQPIVMMRQIRSVIAKNSSLFHFWMFCVLYKMEE